MTTVNVNKIELNEFSGKFDPRQHCKATFPLIGAHGSKKIATVYFELAPGDNLGRHTDSAEELLIVLDGNVSVEVGTENEEATSGTLLLVPEMVPHDIKNTGTRTARVLGVFGGVNNIVATFDQVMVPADSNVVDTALI
jgi:quercetin dioxygenase-like cupin family protein